MGIVLCIDLVSRFDGMKFIPLHPAVTTQTALIWKKGQGVSPLTKGIIEIAQEKMGTI